MRRIVLFFLFFFVFYRAVFALPLLGVIPFVFELSVLLYSAICILISGAFFHLLKYVKAFSFLLILTSWVSSGILYFWIGSIQWNMIHVDISGFPVLYSYLLSGLILFILLGIFLFWKKNTSLWIYVGTFLILLINCSLLSSVWTLNSKFVDLVHTFDTFVGWSLVEVSPKILNNIFVSWTFKYKKDNIHHLCRITLSYYIHAWNSYAREAEKSSELRLYTWLDTGECRKILESFSPIK